jgi:hypothetical protein
MRGLTPSLDVIESNLFDPSVELVRRWLDNDPLLSVEQRAALAEDERFRIFARDLEEAPVAALQDMAPDGVRIPPHLAEKVRQLVTAQGMQIPLAARPGLIVRIDEAVGPEGALGWDMGCPFFVLLSEPTDHDQIWYGWMMSWETDYAGPWDLLIEDQDQPCHPLAGMIQVWNPVYLYMPSASAAVGLLSDARLDAARDLADEMAAMPSGEEGAAGRLDYRTTSGGHLVLTGSRMGDEVADPRWRYQELYFAAAGLLRDLARNVLDAQAIDVAQPWWTRVLDGLRSAAGQAGLSWEPIPVLTLGEEFVGLDTAQPYRLGEFVEVRLVPSEDGNAVQLHFTLLSADPLRIGLARGTRVRQEERLAPDHPEATLFIGADQTLTLFVRSLDGPDLLRTEIMGGASEG